MLSRPFFKSSTWEIPRGNRNRLIALVITSAIKNDYLNFVMTYIYILVYIMYVYIHTYVYKHAPEFLLSKHHPTNKVGVHSKRTRSYGNR